MKKTMIMMLLCAPFIAVAENTKDLQASRDIVSPEYIVYGDWVKSVSGAWPGMKDGKTYWYKLDAKGGLWWSADGKKWSAVDGGTWGDKDGKWLKIHEGKLVWSSDGKEWSEVPEWKWQASDGKWYKFDNSWGLWVNE